MSSTSKRDASDEAAARTLSRWPSTVVHVSSSDALTHDEITRRSIEFRQTVAAGKERNAPSKPLPPGAVVAGRYVVRHFIGAGGMGQVYRVDDRIDNVERAMKLAAPHLYENEAGLLRFQQEMLAMASLRHPNLPVITDYGILEGVQPYLAMELIPGNELGRQLPVRLSDFYEVLVQVLRAISFIHDRGFLHRDLKPSNAIVNRDDTSGSLKLVLVDFGLMERIGNAAEYSIAGTPSYMAPEVVAGRPLDPRTDLYSLGIMAFELLTGRLPFVDKDRERLYDMHQRAPRPHVADLNDDVPAALDGLIFRLIASEPSDRPDDPEEVLRTLSSLTQFVQSSDLQASKAYLRFGKLVARDDQMTALRTVLKGAEHSQVGSCFIEAPPGSGKSRLLSEIQIEALVAGFTVAGVVMREEYRAPYQALRLVLRGLQPAALEAHMLPMGTRVLSRMLPADLAPRSSAVEEERLSPQEERGLLITEVVNWIRNLCRIRPMLIILDDLQWCDDSSLSVFSAMAEHLTDTRFCVITAFRPEELRETPGVMQWRHHDATCRLVLTGFDANQMSEFLSGLLGKHALDSTIAERILTATEGSPFYIIEVLRDMIDRGVLVRSAGIWRLQRLQVELPASLEPLLISRLQTLSPQARELASLLSVAGGNLPVTSVMAVSKSDTTQTLVAIEELVQLHVATIRGGSLALVHDRLREIIYSKEESESRMLLHQRLGEFHECNQVHDPLEQAALLGHHFARGVDQLKGLAYLEIAGRAAFEREEFGVARDLLLDAEAILEVGGRLAFEREDFDLARNLLLDVESQLEKSPDRANAAQRLFSVKTMLGRIGVSDDYSLGADRSKWAYDQAIQRGILRSLPGLRSWLPDPIPFLLILMLKLPVRMLMRGKAGIKDLQADVRDAITAIGYGANCQAALGNLTDARRFAEQLRAFSIGRNSLASAMEAVAGTIFELHQGVAGVSLLKRLLRARAILLSSKGDVLDPYSRALATGTTYYTETMIYAWEQHPKFAAAHQTFKDFAEKTDNWLMRNLVEQAMIDSAVRVGDIVAADNAEGRFRYTIRQIGGQARQREWLANISMGLCDVDAGRFDRASRRVAAFLDEDPQVFTEGFAALIQARLNLAWSKHDEARIAAGRVLRWARDSQVKCGWLEFEGLKVVVEIQLALMEAGAARDTIRLMSRWSDDPEHLTKYHRAQTERFEAILAMQLHPEDSIERAREALEVSAEVGCRRLMADAHLTMADALTLSGAPSASVRSHIQLASQIFSALGNRFQQKRIQSQSRYRDLM